MVLSHSHELSMIITYILQRREVKRFVQAQSSDVTELGMKPRCVGLQRELFICS